MLQKTIDTLKPIVDTKVSALEVEQEAYKRSNAKYLQKLAETKDDVTTEVHEYVCPNKSAGYQVILKKVEDKKEYVMSKGYGEEAKNRTFDWQEVINE